MKIEKVKTDCEVHQGIAEKLNEIIDAVNDNNFRYEEGYSDGYAAGKKDKQKEREQGIYYKEGTMPFDCCEKCADVHYEKTYPAHTPYYACLDRGCECHKQEDEEEG